MLLQEAAYDRLMRRRRRVLHGRVAELLSSRGRIAWESEPERIAYHWESAGELGKRSPAGSAPGRRALEQAAFHEAAAHFKRARRDARRSVPGERDGCVRGELLADWGAAMQAGEHAGG